MKEMLLVLNPRSGRRKANKALPQIQSIFEQAGFHVSVHITTGPGDCTQVVAQMARQVDVVVCCGGDGTFNETVNGLLQSGADTPLGYIPAGSTNDFAASLLLPGNLLEAARAIAEGTPQYYDIGMVNDRYFSYVASFGAFTRSSYATRQSVKNRIGFLAYLFSGVTDLFRLRSVAIEAELDGEQIRDKFLFGAVSNSTRMGGIFKLDPKRVDMADGKLELMLIRKPKNPIELVRCLRDLLRRRYDCRMITFRSVSQVRFHCPKGMVWTLDGERYDAPQTLEITDLPRAIRLIKKG